MKLLKLYRGKDNHHLAMYRDDEGLLYYTATPVGKDQEPTHVDCEAWIILEELEYIIYKHPKLMFKPVPLIVCTYEGRRYYFETTADLQAYFSNPSFALGDEPARVADLLDRKVPVGFGKIKAYREKPWYFNVKYGDWPASALKLIPQNEGICAEPSGMSVRS